jgi:hypothetical protein
MSIIKQSLKQLEDIYINIYDAQISGSNVYVKGNISSYYNSDASMSLFEYSLDSGSTFISGTIFDVQIEGISVTQSKVPLKGKEKYIDVVWDAGTDITGLRTYDQVMFRENWQVSGNVAPELSSSVTSSIFNLAFTSSNNIALNRPYPIDDSFTASFQSSVAPITHRNHYTVFWDTSSLFPSASIASTQISTSNWWLDDAAFPVSGALTTGSLENALEIMYTGLGGLTNNQTYYLYVSRSSFAV